MKITDVKKLIPGQHLREKRTGRDVTVITTIPEPTSEYPASSGQFPLILVRHGKGGNAYAIAYTLLRHSH